MDPNVKLEQETLNTFANYIHIGLYSNVIVSRKFYNLYINSFLVFKCALY